MTPLEHEDIVWIAERIHECRQSLREHPQWNSRIMDLVALLVWPASVDGKQGGIVVKDGWIASGGGLRLVHFQRAPHTPLALEALRSGKLQTIKREHVVPRNTLRGILLKTLSIDDSVRVIKAYSIVALVHESETRRIRPSASMPPGWAADVNWSQGQLPAQLPTPWERYSKATPPVVPINPNGAAAY